MKTNKNERFSVWPHVRYVGLWDNYWQNVNNRSIVVAAPQPRQGSPIGQNTEVVTPIFLLFVIIILIFLMVFISSQLILKMKK
jgi:hypothetical protein